MASIQNSSRKRLRRSVLALALSVGGVSAAFSNVTHIATTTIAFGSASSTDGVDMIVPGSNGGSVGVYESMDGGVTVDYDSTVGPTATSPLLMAAATSGSASNFTSLVGGLFGAAIKVGADATTWAKAAVPAGVVTQDIKYEAASGAFALTGTVAGTGAAAVLSYDNGATFTTVPVTGLFSNADIRYGSYPTKDTFYVTAGFWGDGGADPSTWAPAAGVGMQRALSARLSVGADGKISVGEYNATGAWAQVAKTTDGGATWTLVFEDFASDQYPNDISCFDASTCTFAMEGNGSPPRILSTTDGGATWAMFTDTSGGTSLMPVRMTGPTEAWVAGGGDVGRLWHTTDLTTWEASTTAVTDAASFVSFALGAGNTMAYATGILRSQLCSILKLEM